MKEECGQKGDQTVIIRGKCLVWDIEKNTVSKAHQLLPEDYAAKNNKGQLTVFLVAPGKKEQVGNYSISNAAAYRQYMKIYVLYWPEKEAVAIHTVMGNSPPKDLMTQPGTRGGEVVGKTAEPIAEWIQTLQKE